MQDALRAGAALLLLGLAIVGPGAAQAPGYEQTVLASARLAQLAGRAAAPVPVDRVTGIADDIVAQRRRARRDPGTVFLIVGGAVAVAGLLAEEDLLVIGGVVVAGYGLYLNLR